MQAIQIQIRPTTDKLLERLVEVVREQHRRGKITDKEISNFIELVANDTKLKRAKLFL